MVDQELLTEKTKLLAEYIGDLEEKTNVRLNELKENKILRRYIERTLHLAVEACLDIGNHLIADLELREPQDYKDISERSIPAEISHCRLRSRCQFNPLATSDPEAENQRRLNGRYYPLRIK
jgi:hypothetical protein